MREIIKNSDELNYFISMLSTTGGKLKSSSSKIFKTVSEGQKNQSIKKVGNWFWNY